jgi:chorismate dehydratase
VRSLLVVSKDPIRFAKRIALDRSSRSTQALTRILCANRWNIAPEFREAEPDFAAMLAESDAALVIGDPALRVAIAAEAKAKPGRDGEWICEGSTVGLPQFNTLHVYDVVREWWQMAERPAVLAVWAARPEIASEGVADEFLASLNYGLQNLDAICKESASEMNLPDKELKLYLKTNIDYSLDDENRKGLLAYYSHAVKLGLIEKLSPITIAARSGVPARTIDFSWVKSPSKM